MLSLWRPAAGCAHRRCLYTVPLMNVASASSLAAPLALGRRQRLVGMASANEQAADAPSTSGVQGVQPMRTVMVVVKEARWEQAEVGVVTVLQQAFPDLYSTSTGAKRACRRKEVCVDGIPVNTTASVLPGQQIQIMARSKASDVPDVRPELALPPLEVLYEDDHLAVVYKPSGLPTQGSGHDTAHARMKFCLKPSEVPGALHRPQHVHRLDAPTCGLLLGAKTRLACAQLTAALKSREVKKRYLALLKGQLEVGSSGRVEQPLKGKSAVTDWEVLQVYPSTSFGWLTTVSLRPLTGRKHQLRRHMAESLGCPILGETRYFATGARGVAAATAGGAVQRRREGENGEEVGGAPSAAPGAESAVAGCERAVGDDAQALRGLAPGVPAGSEEPSAVSQHQAGDQAQVLDDGANEDQDEGGESSEDDEEEEVAVGQAAGAVGGNGAEQHVGHKRPRGGAGGGRRRDVLADGQLADLCLCAVELQFAHPVTQEPIHVSIATGEPPYFQHVRMVEVAGASTQGRPTT